MDTVPAEAGELSVTKTSLEYLSVISSEGDLLIVPVWRFRAGEDIIFACTFSYYGEIRESYDLLLNLDMLY